MLERQIKMNVAFLEMKAWFGVSKPTFHTRASRSRIVQTCVCTSSCPSLPRWGFSGFHKILKGVHDLRKLRSASLVQNLDTNSSIFGYITLNSYENEPLSCFIHALPKGIQILSSELAKDCPSYPFLVFSSLFRLKSSQTWSPPWFTSMATVTKLHS